MGDNESYNRMAAILLVLLVLIAIMLVAIYMIAVPCGDLGPLHWQHVAGSLDMQIKFCVSCATFNCEGIPVPPVVLPTP